MRQKYGPRALRSESDGSSDGTRDLGPRSSVGRSSESDDSHLSQSLSSSGARQAPRANYIQLLYCSRSRGWGLRRGSGASAPAPPPESERAERRVRSALGCPHARALPQRRHTHMTPHQKITRRAKANQSLAARLLSPPAALPCSASPLSCRAHAPSLPRCRRHVLAAARKTRSPVAPCSTSSLACQARSSASPIQMRRHTSSSHRQARRRLRRRRIRCIAEEILGDWLLVRRSI